MRLEVGIVDRENKEGSWSSYPINGWVHMELTAVRHLKGKVSAAQTPSQNGRSIASSLLVVDKPTSKAYGRYWGAIEHVPCLHFELAYYQAIEYCINQGIQLFEGGAQGEHKMARGFLPTTIQSAHWIADSGFSKAVKRFLERERTGMAAYVDEPEQHNPLKSTKVRQ